MKKTKLILTILGVLGFLSVAAFGAAYYIQQQQNIDPDGSKAAVMCTTDFECNGGVCRNGYCTALTQCEGESSQCGVPGADPCCTGLECKPMTGSNTYSCQKITAPTACKRWFDGCNNCTRSTVGGDLACTRRGCATLQTPMCNEFFPDTEIGGTITKTTNTDSSKQYNFSASWTSTNGTRKVFLAKCSGINPGSECKTVSSTFSCPSNWGPSGSGPSMTNSFCKFNVTGNNVNFAFNANNSNIQPGKYVVGINQEIPNGQSCSGNPTCTINGGQTDCGSAWVSCHPTSDYVTFTVPDNNTSCNTDNDCTKEEICNAQKQCEVLVCGAGAPPSECYERAPHSCEFVKKTDGTACTNGTCQNGVCIAGDFCTDTDGGKDYFVKGSVNYCATIFGSKNCAVKTDACTILQGTVEEYFCNGNLGMSSQYACPNGCSDGKCLPAPSPSPSPTVSPSPTPAPCVPTQTAPANNGSVTSNPTFTWGACTGVTNPKYQLIVKKGTTEAGKVLTTATSYQFTDITWENNTAYTWTIKLCPNADCVGGTPSNAFTFTYNPGAKTRNNCQGDHSICELTERCYTGVTPNRCSGTASEVCTVPTGKTAACVNLTIANRTCGSTDRPDGTNCGTTGQICQAGICTNPPTTDYSKVKGIDLKVKLGKRTEKSGYTYPTAFVGVWRDSGTTSKMLTYKITGFARNVEYKDTAFLSQNGTAAYTLTGEDYLIIKPESYLSKAYKIKALTITNNTIVLNDAGDYLAGDTIIDTGTFDSINVRDYVFFRDFFGRDNTYDYYYIDYNGNGSVTIHDAVEYRNNLGKAGATKDLNPLVINAIQTAMEGSLYKVIKL